MRFAAINLVAWILSVILLAGCEAQLVPAYSPEILKGLTDGNERTLVLFSAVSGGAAKSTFSTHAGTYDELIGKFGALKAEAAARDIPPLDRRAYAFLQRAGLMDSDCLESGECQNPTPRILDGLIANLERMRDTHRSSGLGPQTAEIFKNGHEIFAGQAIAFETSLER